MNILIHIPEVNQGWGGVRNYVATFIRSLTLPEQSKVFIYHNCADPEILEAAAHLNNVEIVRNYDIQKSERIWKRRSFHLLNKFFFRLGIKKRYLLPNVYSLFCSDHKIDILHCPYQELPNVKGPKLISTLHDVQELYYPEFFSAEIRAYRANAYLDIVRRADKILVSYNHVKEDLIKYFNVPSEKIVVVILPMDKLWFNRFLSKSVDTGQFTAPLKPYLLYPANSWPHKNHLGLIKAIKLLNKKDIMVNLVLTGELVSPQKGKILSYIKANQLEEQIAIKGVVSEMELFSLYKNSRGVVIPTLYEAGSFPLMESIIMRIPVICSNVTSLPDTIKDLDFVFDPKNIEQMSHKIERLWTDPLFRERNLEVGLKIIPKLVQNSAGPIISSIFEELKHGSLV